MARTGKTQTDWIKVGQALLINGGIEAVKLHRLTDELQVSTGSFYHHFKNLETYLTELANFYGREQAQQMFDEARALAGEDPRLLLQEATGIFGRGSMRQLNIAMRAWAHSDDRALAAVQRYDEFLMGALDETFLALGFDPLAAKSRTLIMMGLASVEIDTDIQPSFGQRWEHIRDLILQPSIAD